MDVNIFGKCQSNCAPTVHNLCLNLMKDAERIFVEGFLFLGSFTRSSPVLPLLVLSLAANVNGTDLHYVLAHWNLYLYCVCISIAIIRNSLIGFPAIIHPHPLIPGSFISRTTTATESYSLITLETCTDCRFSTLSLSWMEQDHRTRGGFCIEEIL